MQYIFLTIGTVLAILFLVQMNRGKKYATILEGLDEKAFPLHELYGVGFMWSETSVFRLKGKQAMELKTNAGLLYEPQYADYYANVYWAQTLMFVHLLSACTFLLAGFMYSAAALVLVAGIFLTAVMGLNGIQGMKNTLSQRTQECESQLPEVVSTLAILINSGMILREAWTMVGDNGKGAFYDLMQQASDNMKNAHSDADAIFLFGRSSNSVEIKKFTSALLQSMEKGGAELTAFLANQSTELWSLKRQKMLQGGEKAATKLLGPIVIIFVGIVIIVMTAAFAGSLF